MNECVNARRQIEHTVWFCPPKMFLSAPISLCNKLTRVEIVLCQRDWCLAFLSYTEGICYPQSWLCGCSNSLYPLQRAAAISTADVLVFVRVCFGCQKLFIGIIRNECENVFVFICVSLSVSMCAWLLIGCQCNKSQRQNLVNFMSELKWEFCFGQIYHFWLLPTSLTERYTFILTLKISIQFNIEKENTVWF